jgi:hypothetical protein
MGVLFPEMGEKKMLTLQSRTVKRRDAVSAEFPQSVQGFFQQRVRCVE